jgi:hypothetical protein
MTWRSSALPQLTAGQHEAATPPRLRHRAGNIDRLVETALLPIRPAEAQLDGHGSIVRHALGHQARRAVEQPHRPARSHTAECGESRVEIVGPHGERRIGDALEQRQRHLGRQLVAGPRRRRTRHDDMIGQPVEHGGLFGREQTGVAQALRAQRLQLRRRARRIGETRCGYSHLEDERSVSVRTTLQLEHHPQASAGDIRAAARPAEQIGCQRVALAI